MSDADYIVRLWWGSIEHTMQPLSICSVNVFWVVLGRQYKTVLLKSIWVTPILGFKLADLKK